MQIELKVTATERLWFDSTTVESVWVLFVFVLSWCLVNIPSA